MDVNEILGQYKDINSHIDEINKGNKIDFDTKMGTAQGQEFVKGLISKGKATQDVISGVSGAAQGIVDKGAAAAKAAKASKLAGGTGEAGDIELQAIGTGSKAAKATSAVEEVGEVAATGGRLASAAKSTVGVLSKGGAAFGVGMGVFDVGEDIYNDVKNKSIGITGDNWQEKAGHVGEEISGALDAAGLALGPEFMLAGALVGGASELLNIWGGSKDHEGVPEPPPPVVEQNVTPPNLAQLGMVQNHINNIKQFTN